MGLFDSFRKKENDLKIDYSNHPFHYKFLQGENCDEIPNVYGEFGRTPTNPIPVYGPKGLIIYLNKLRTSQGQPFLFHKLTYTVTAGLTEGVDAFEIVSVDNTNWDILYFHMYHPRNSEKAPGNLILKNDDTIFLKIPVGIGVNEFDPIFPYNIGNLADKNYGSEFNIKSVVEKFLKATTFFRTQEQSIKVLHVNNIAKVFNQLVDGCSKLYPLNFFLNLLESSDLYAHVFALKCLESRTSISDNVLMSLARYCYKSNDNAVTELSISIIKKHHPDLHELHCHHVEYFAISPIPDMVLMLISPFYNEINEDISYLAAVPYLKQLELNQYANSNLKNYCKNKIQEIISLNQ
jgi:hypothetical protein